MNTEFRSKTISVIGAGLAGSECALQLAQRGFQVKLYEMRPQFQTPAHKSAQYAELVCSNSFGSQGPAAAPGQLKWEAELFGSHILRIARENAVPAGMALGIDREKFANQVTLEIQNNPNIQIIEKKITSLSEIERPAVIATGPLTSPELSEDLLKHFGDEFLYFFDAIAPIVDADSIDLNIAWRQDRYDKGDADYLNCPLNEEEYLKFIEEIKLAKKIEPKYFETTDFFEGCMPIETMVERGFETLRFGPMKPVGLRDPRTGKRPHAVVQLRQENKEVTSYNLVGFQTRMAYAEQVRIFKMIPGLQNAEFLKLGSIHRNMFINSPLSLNQNLSSKKDPSLFFAGQITGVEGYFESTCIGLLVSYFVEHHLSKNKPEHPQAPVPPIASAFGALLKAITDPERGQNFQPTNINFGLLPPLIIPETPQFKALRRDKGAKKILQINRARREFSTWLQEIGRISCQKNVNFLPTEQENFL